MNVKWTKPAQTQLREIFDYYNSNADEIVAQKIVAKITSRIGILSHNPLGAQRELSLEDRPEGFRRLVAGNHKIVYWIVDNEVWIAAVFDTRRNPTQLRKMVLNIEN
jgi:plasmid stabilization system protein ParE